MKKDRPKEEYDLWSMPDQAEPGFWQASQEDAPTALYHRDEIEDALNENSESQPTTLMPRSVLEAHLAAGLQEEAPDRSGASPTAVPMAPPTPPTQLEGITPQIHQRPRSQNLHRPSPRAIDLSGLDAISPGTISPGAISPAPDGGARPRSALGGDEPALGFSDRSVLSDPSPALASPPPMPRSLQDKTLLSPPTRSDAVEATPRDHDDGPAIHAPGEPTLRQPEFNYVPREAPQRRSWWRRMLGWLGLG